MLFKHWPKKWSRNTGGKERIYIHMYVLAKLTLRNWQKMVCKLADLAKCCGLWYSSTNVTFLLVCKNLPGKATVRNCIWLSKPSFGYVSLSSHMTKKESTLCNLIF